MTPEVERLHALSASANLSNTIKPLNTPNTIDTTNNNIKTPNDAGLTLLSNNDSNNSRNLSND